MALPEFADLGFTIEGHIATLEIQRPPHNYLDIELVDSIASALEFIDRETEARAVLLCSAGRSFCAGANLRGDGPAEPPTGNRRGREHLYREAVRLFETGTPIVAAVHGNAIGAGLGLALTADFRVCTPDARLTASFSRLGFHNGFGTTATLPRVVGQQWASRLLMTGMDVSGEQALKIGLVDELADAEDLRERALELANEIASAAPLAVRSIRRTLRRGYADDVRRATDTEQVEQDWLRRTADFKEGVRATAERRAPDFQGR
ncbi:MAG: enoyl-CoA hydratase/isomerase family protein [Dehalococcoidia bacterium]